MKTKQSFLMPMSKSRKGFVGPVISAIINIIGGLLIVAGLIIGVAAFGSSQTAGSFARNLTNNIGFMTNNFGAQLPVVGTILAIVIIISAISLLTLSRQGK